MQIFLDTEFTHFINCDLISIALISEDGQHEFYGERTDFDHDSCSDFVHAAVLAHLGEFPEAMCVKAQLAERLRIWLKAMPFNIIIACDSQMDYELLHDLLEGDLPINITGHYNMRALIDKPAFNKPVCAYHSVPSQHWHHALHDVRAQRLGWLAWDRHTPTIETTKQN